jgi:hypothetical protein
MLRAAAKQAGNKPTRYKLSVVITRHVHDVAIAHSACTSLLAQS